MEETLSGRVWELRGSGAWRKEEEEQIGSHGDRPGEEGCLGCAPASCGTPSMSSGTHFHFLIKLLLSTFCVWDMILETEENTMRKINSITTFSLLPSLCAQIYMMAVLMAFLSSHWDYWSSSLPLKFSMFLNVNSSLPFFLLFLTQGFSVTTLELTF